MPHHSEPDFSADAEIVDFSALLFDMDGTIIDSTPAIVKYWQETGREIGVDGDGKFDRNRSFSIRRAKMD
jgi:glycerol 3-phosphatase-1